MMDIFWRRISWIGSANAAPKRTLHNFNLWRLGPLPLLLLLVTASGLDAARSPGSDGAALLRKAEAADRRVTYVGTKQVFCTDRHTTAVEQEVRVWHAPPDKTRLEVLPPARIAGLITVEVGDQQFHFHPWSHRWITLPRPYRPPLELLLKNYVLREVAGETIAGRSARGLQIRSRHPGNSQKNLWIDRQTGVVLKAEILDEGGRRLSWWQFRDIEFPSAVSAELFSTPATAPVPLEGPRPQALPLQRVDRPTFVPAVLRFLPPGYSEVRRSTYRSGGKDRVVVRYTDGLNVILFVQQLSRPSGGEEGKPSRDRERRETRPDGGVSGRRYRHGPPPSVEGDMGTRLSWRLGELRLTLVGGVDRRQLERMAASATVPNTKYPIDPRTSRR